MDRRYNQGSNIDLSFYSNELTLRTDLEVGDDPHGSDIFPTFLLVTLIKNSNIHECIPTKTDNVTLPKHFNPKRINLAIFQEIVIHQISTIPNEMDSLQQYESFV